ncbi:MAG: LamG domain-containing protein, partial [Patescibacteria group bacterium]|nr:LamG domain-containing protein [Patescibacteria group bacterium]
YNRAISKREALQLYETGPPPVLHLKMDENTGTTAYDTSENSNDGAFGGSPEWKGAEECRYGGCLDFDGASDYLQVSDHNTLDIKGAITLSAWVKPDSFNHSGGGNNPRILDKGNFVLYSYNATGNITAYTFGLSDIEIISDTAIPLDQWSYVVATYDQSTGNKIVYINGIEDKKETSVTGEININVADLYIGDRSAGDRNWDGKIDDVRVYNYARTPKQIAEDMMAGAPATSNRVEASDGDGPASGPVLYYKFDDLHMATTSDYSNVRAIVKDQSGRGNHGEVYNATSTPGKFGNALGFDGALDYVDLPNFSSTAQTYTFSMWVKSPIADGTTDYLFDTATGRFLLAFFGTTSGQIGFYDGAMKNFGDAPNDGEWHHLVWLFDSSASTGKLYIDGSQFGNTQSYTAMNISGNVKIGSHNDPPIGSWYTGKIDEFKIYEYLLDEDEIKVEYNRGKALMVAPPENPTVTASGAHPGGSAPIMHLTFDEKIGTTSTDRTGNGNDGGIVDGTWKGSGYCKKGGCLEFDGSDDYVRVVDTNILDFGTGDFSVSWWAKLIDIDASNFMISKYPPNATEGAFDFGTTATGDDIDFLVRDNTTGGTYSRVTSSGVSITDNKWHHFVATRNDQELNAYVDGVLAGTHSGLASGSDVSNSSNLLIGARQSSLFQGNIDDVKIWDRALTVAEVAYEYNKGEPVGHWKFDEGDGDWAYDASGNDNHGYVVIGEGGTNVATSTAWQNGATGKINGSLDFDKTDDCMELKNSSLLSPGTGEITLSAWIKTSDDFSSTAGAIYSDYGSVTNNLVSVYIQTDNKIEITFRDSAGHKLEIKNEGPVVNDGLWHHVVSVRTSQTTASYYLDGELIATDTDGNVATITVSDGTVPTIGSYTSTLLFFGGQIDDVRIYNYARNPSQIKQDYNYGKSLYFK